MQQSSLFRNCWLPHSSIVSIKGKGIFFSFQFQRGELAIYNRVTTVNLTAVNTNMNTTNNYHVELEQNGGMTVVGDNANINNYHQPPHN